jgi:hypothetical protein
VGGLIALQTADFLGEILRGVSGAKGASSPLLGNRLRAVLGALRILLVRVYPQEGAYNYRKDYRTPIGLSYKVTVVFTESLLQSDRGCSYKVTVDKLLYPNGL